MVGELKGLASGGAFIVIGLLILAGGGRSVLASEDPRYIDPRKEDFAAMGRLFDENCATCHGANLRGAAQGVALVGRDLRFGDSVAELQKTIGTGFPDKGMPAWASVLTEAQIHSLAIYVKEVRQGMQDMSFRVREPLTIPTTKIASELHAFRFQVLADALGALPYAMAYLPDGRILVTDKLNGLILLSATGERTVVSNTPHVRPKEVMFADLDQGNGWMLGVAVHPDYRKNGWIYLSYGEVCDDCENVDPKNPLLPTMTKLVRGKLRGSEWTDQQVIWSTEKKNYTPGSDMVAGGNIAFDGAGHVFMSVGIKGGYVLGIQDLHLPYGKIHRVYDDGRIPEDNPFVGIAGAVKSTWAYGFRNPEGLFFNRKTRQLWATDHGPRGGDEVNLVTAGSNYGWPLYSLGVNYDGSPVEFGKLLGIKFNLEDIVQPVVDLTPSPAISSVIVYQANAFPKWRDSLILGTLKARSLYRVVLKDNKEWHRETLFSGIGRIRQVQQSPEGYIDLLIEHPAGGKIVRLLPARN